MGTPFISEIRLISFNYPPKGWAFCNGQTLAINQNQALFSLIGTNYGGNGQTTFQLPNLQGRSPINQGGGHIIGESAGEVTHALVAAELPGHTHQAQGVTTVANVGSPAGEAWADSAADAFAATSNATMGAATVAQAGGGQPHENRPPALTLNYIIALQGIFPSQN